MASELPTATGLAAKFADNIHGKVVLITGPSPNSIAAQFAISLAPYGPKLLILAGRSASKMDETAKAVQAASATCATRTVIVDFGSLESVRKASKEVNEYSENIDVVMHSAGIMAPPYIKSVDGFESSFVTNHLGPFLFINNIMGKIRAAAKGNPGGSRVVTVSSEGHALGTVGKTLQEIGFNDGKTYNKWHAYGQSKTANCLYALSLSNKLSEKYNIQAYSLHPGVIMSTSLGNGLGQEDWTGLFQVRDEVVSKLSRKRREESTNEFTKLVAADKLEGITVDQGAATLMVAGFDPSIKAQTGSYLRDAKIDNNGAEDHAKDPAEAERLWALSEECVGKKFDF